MTSTKLFFLGSFALVACLLRPTGSQADDAAQFGQVLKAYPGDLHAPFRAMAVPDIVAVLNQNLEGQAVSVNGCNLEWEWSIPPSDSLPYKALKARVDSREVRFGGGEVHNGRLLYHPEADGEKFAIMAPDGKILLRQSWHTLAIKDAHPATYWKAVGAFSSLAERIARTCATTNLPDAQ